MKKEIIINASKDRSRIAIVEDGELVELYVENPENVRTIGNIYLGQVQKVMPAIRAAFVDLGEKQDAFLHFSDLTENAAQLFAMAGEDVPGLETPVLARAPQKRVADDEDEPDVEETLEVESGGESSRTRRSSRSRRGRGRGRGRGRRREEEEEQEERRRGALVIDLTSGGSSRPKSGPKRPARKPAADTPDETPTTPASEPEAPVEETVEPMEAPASATETDETQDPSEEAPRPRRRSRSRSRSARREATPAPQDEAPAPAPDPAPMAEAETPDAEADEAPRSARNRSRSRGNEGPPTDDTPEASTEDATAQDATAEAPDAEADADADEASERPRRRSRRRGGRRNRGRSDDNRSDASPNAEADDAEATADTKDTDTRSRGRSRSSADEAPAAEAEKTEVEETEAAPAKAPRARSRRRGPAVVDLTSSATSTPKAKDTDDEASDDDASRSRRGRRAEATAASDEAPATERTEDADESADETGGSRRRSRSRSRGRSRDESSDRTDGDSEDTDGGRSRRRRGASAEASDDTAADDRSSRRRSRSSDDDGDAGRDGGRGRSRRRSQDDDGADRASGRGRSGRSDDNGDDADRDAGRGRSGRRSEASSDDGDARSGRNRDRGRSDRGRSDRGRGGSGRGRSGSRSASTNQNVPPAQELLKRGTRVLVKVTKEPISSKGSRVSTDISLAGRFLVLVPAADYIAVSKKIESSKERRRLKSLAQSLKPDDCGVIVRTVAEGRDAKSLDTDLRLLIEKWDKIKEGLAGRPKPPKTLYTDVNMVSSIIRDLFSEDFDRILIDDPKVYKNVKAYVQAVAPDMADNVVLHKTKAPIFRATGLEKQVEEAFSRRVNMKGGGYLFIETTEAMHVVDVNSGRAGRGKSQKENLMAVNLESAREIAKQLRLRDLGGIIVVDFIDLRHESDRRKVTDELKKHFQKDRAVTKVLPMSDFGLVQITRQRLRPSITANATDDDGSPLDAAEAAAAAGAGEIPQAGRRAAPEEAPAPAAEAPARPALAPEEATPSALAGRVRAWLDHYRSAVDERYRGRPIVVRVHPLLGEFLRRGFISTLTRWRLGLRGIAFRIEEDATLDPLAFDVRDEKSGRSLLSKYSA